MHDWFAKIILTFHDRHFTFNDFKLKFYVENRAGVNFSKSNCFKCVQSRTNVRKKNLTTITRRYRIFNINIVYISKDRRQDIRQEIQGDTLWENIIGWRRASLLERTEESNQDQASLEGRMPKTTMEPQQQQQQHHQHQEHHQKQQQPQGESASPTESSTSRVHFWTSPWKYPNSQRWQIQISPAAGEISGPFYHPWRHSTLLRFLGMVNFDRFLPKAAHHLAFLNAFLSALKTNDSRELVWFPETVQAFESSKQQLVDAALHWVSSQNNWIPLNGITVPMIMKVIKG